MKEVERKEWKDRRDSSVVRAAKSGLIDRVVLGPSGLSSTRSRISNIVNLTRPGATRSTLHPLT